MNNNNSQITVVGLSLCTDIYVCVLWRVGGVCPVILGAVQSEVKAPGRVTKSRVISMERPDNSDEKDKVLEGRRNCHSKNVNE